ncbi:S-layer homology domain-containing protein [Paenibacillus sinopodophylli]|uniref:S-layer homology domain-containing protein n=1 Tax=Paenibacillus sinopodophylli TaxID=1837342 RepID=UPI001FE9526C|nr:S-layer homology domain-containing protein [Paenibacillus sinopodophylli]
MSQDKLYGKQGRRWMKRVVAMLVAVNLLTGTFLSSLPLVSAAPAPSGGSYFTDTDNWGGGAAGSAADGDMDIGIKNQNQQTADNYSKYPVEFKIANVDALPTKSAHLLIRALDVDEFDTPTSMVGDGEWDRVYFSANPADIAFGPSYTTWPTTTAWTNNIAASGITPGGQGYKKELNEAAYLGTLSGKDGIWNTSVLTFKPEDFDRIALGDNYVGVTIHHFYKDLRSLGTTPNTNWQMTVDWGQLVIDGGSRRTGEIESANVKVESGKVIIDTSFLPKLPNKNYSIEVNVIEKRNVGGEEVEKNLGLVQQLFTSPVSGVVKDWNDITISNTTINPANEYKINIILFDDRGGGRAAEGNTNAGEAQHLYSFSTFDPVVKDIAKPATQYDPTTFAVSDFTSKYYRLNGQAQPGNLEKVKIVTLPSGGKLQLLGVDVQVGDEIAKDDLSNLKFVPAASGFTGTASFNWNGYDGANYASLDAVVTLTANAAPIVAAIAKTTNQGIPVVFAAVDFTSYFVDTTIPAESLSKVKLVSLPDSELGTLWIANSSGQEVKAVIGDEINTADLGKLRFVPEDNTIGDVLFQWNGSDGKQYAKSHSTVHISINAAPIVSDIAYAAIAGSIVELKAADFANADAFTDEEGETLSQVRLQLPADFATKGRLNYISGGVGKQLAPGTLTALSLTELNTLRFVPAANLADDSTVVFAWYGRDGGQYSIASANVSITYTNAPVAGNIAKAGLQYEPISFSADDFKNHYSKASGASNAEGLTTVKIVTLPDAAQGFLQLDGAEVLAGDEIAVTLLGDLAFVPASSGFTGIASFDWNGYDGVKYAALDATVTITANAAPIIDPINKSSLKGEAVPFAAADFTSKYSDSGSESLTEVKLVTLPASNKGKLVLRDSGGLDTEITAAGYELAASDLAKLIFIPEPGVTGTVTFGWNGSDGKQYAKDSKQITITINTPPVVGDINKTGLSGQVIVFEADDFANPPRYTDADGDGDSLKEIAIALPAQFDASGKLWYSSSVGQSVYLEQGSTAIIDRIHLDSLRFQPSASLPEGSSVAFDWKGSDGKQLSEAPAKVNIAYNGKPIAETVTINVTEGTSEIIIVFKGTDAESVTGIVYGLETNPSKGTIRPADDDVSGDTWIYTPNTDFISGQDSFTYNVSDEDGQTGETPAVVTINIHRLLDGWVGDKAQGDPSVASIIPGEQLGLAAVSSWIAEGVTANVNGIVVPLTLANPDTFVLDGYKKWVNTTYLLPSDTAGKAYLVTFDAVDGEGRDLSPEPAARLMDNHFEVIKAELVLSANPDQILGDGKSTTELSALLTNEDGSPLAGITVVFTAPAGKGEFVGGNTAVTNEQGIAVVTYKSPQITGVSEQQIPIQVNVYNKSLGLKAQEEVIITSLPAAVKGFITKGDNNTPVAGASVRITLDLDGDGIITAGVDFDQTVLTDVSGAYYAVVPKGGVTYALEVSQTVDIGGVPTTVTYNQTAQVGEVTGAGEENFDSEKTVTGIVLFKQPSGESSLFSGDLLAKTHIYVKKADGSYVLEGGVPKAFELNEQGVFHADGLAIGEYELEIGYEIEPGKTITFSRAAVSVTASGELNISESLVDPYGTITDSVTKAVIEGAEVVLHYADTARNKSKGITPNVKVVVPVLVGFEPNDNASPLQLSDEHGFYAYMVYPETDYYLLVTKNGYQSYTSPVLSVEWEIVKHDLELTPISRSTPAASPALTLSVDKNKVREGTASIITVDYKNTSSSTLAAGEIKVTIPADAIVINAAGGTVSGQTIVWNIANVASGQGGSYKVTLEWPLMKAADTTYDVRGELLANGATVKSSVQINVFSDRFGELTHYRYILGYPDKEFKPEGSLTRAELAAIVARLTENENIDSTLPYNDIREGHWAMNYIKIAVKHQYFSGYEDGTFRPDAAVTRGELASVMARFLKLEVSEPTSAYFKDTAGHWAANAIEALYNGKFLTGYTDGSFKPKNAIKRVEAVTMINQMLYRGPLLGVAPTFPDMPQSHWGFGNVQEATISHKAERNSDGSEQWLETISDSVK